VCDDVDAIRCGNGTLDSCEICFSSDDGPIMCETQTESCEGDNLGGGSCVSQGFAGGALSCDMTCRFDARDCDSCASRPDLVCQRPRVDAVESFRFALASDGTTLAAVWDTLDDVLHVATWDSELSLVGEQPCAAVERVAAIALGPTTDGFVLGLGQGGDNPALELRRLDFAGAELAVARVLDDATFPAFVGQPAAPPLLAYAQTDFAGASETAIALELLDESAQALWQVVLPEPAMPQSLSGAFVGDGFLIASAPVPATALGTWVVHVDLAGNLGASSWLPEVEQLVLAPAAAGQSTAVWLQTDAYWAARFDAGGAMVGTPVAIAETDPTVADQIHVTASVGARDFAGVVENTRGDLRAAHLVDGASVDTYVLASEPGGLGFVGATTLGTSIVVGWTAGWDRLVLARVTP
jgi:hypothetical protein